MKIYKNFTTLYPMCEAEYPDFHTKVTLKTVINDTP